MASRIQIQCDDSVKDQLDKLCANLDLKVTAESRGAVVTYLIGQTKELVKLREQFKTLVDENDASRTKVEELEFDVEALQEEIVDLKSVVQAHQRAMIFALNAKPKG